MVALPHSNFELLFIKIILLPIKSYSTHNLGEGKFFAIYMNTYSNYIINKLFIFVTV